MRLAYSPTTARDSTRLRTWGSSNLFFTRENMSNLTGTIAIGHARYSTIGKGDLMDVQPFLLSFPHGLGMVHNGNIVNCGDLAKDLRVHGYRNLLTHSDTEVVLNLFAEGLAKAPAQLHPSGPEDGVCDLGFEPIYAAVTPIFQKVNGSYSIVTLIADQGLVAFRDPHGIRPLVLGKKKAPSGGSAYMVASESVALSFLGYDFVRDIQPGEVLFIDLKGRVHSRVHASFAEPRPRHCMFEWVYFASPESVIDGVPVYGTRINLGKNLGHSIKRQLLERKIEPDIVVPVPETSRIAAIALAEVLGVPYREVLIKNRYIKRTFILDSQEKRQSAVNLKLSPVRSEIAGKRVLLVDDSIVRGTTSRKIVELVRSAGATEVYFVSTCPPIQHPCYYGIDFPVESELIASHRNLAEIEKELGADAVIYQELGSLEKSILESGLHAAPKGKSKLCMACLDGKYPTDISSGSRFATARSADRKGDRVIPTLYRGSVKDLLGPVKPSLQGDPSAVVFEYTDAYSVFDWGRMPDLLPKKGEALATLAANFFERLELPESWKEFSRTPEALALRKGNKFGSVFNELGEELQSKGLRTHYLGALDSQELQPKQTSALSAPCRRLLVKQVSVVKPQFTTVLGRALPDYYPTRTSPPPRLVPLEVVFRMSCPEGSSLLERIERDPGYLASLGFPELKATPGVQWNFPVLSSSPSWKLLIVLSPFQRRLRSQVFLLSNFKSFC